MNLRVSANVWKIRGCLVKAVEAVSEQEPLDIVVPISKVDAFVKYVNQLEAESKMQMISFGHAGDGKVHDFLTVGAAAPLQEAIVTGLKFDQDYYDDLTAKYTHKRDLMLKGLDDIGLKHNVPQGAYYIMIDFSDYMKKLNVTSDLEFGEILARDVGVGMVPGSSFFKEPINDYLRIHFAKKDDTLNEALNRLSDINAKLKL